MRFINVAEQIRHFVDPKSVAIIGASRQTGEDAFNILENLLDGGYRGRVYPVNPHATEIVGLKAYPRVGELPEIVDLVVITLPRHLVPGVVRECVEKGISAITVVSQGFADADDEQGKRLQKEVECIIEGTGVRLLGPNTFGTANAYADFSSSFVKLKMGRMPVGLICQTGAFFIGFTDFSLLGKGIDLGDACDVDFADGLEYFEQDAQTKVIALHIEGMKEATRFLRTVRRVAKRKPVIALKTGRSGPAARAAQSHTGSLVGRDEIWDVALKNAGVMRARDIEDFCDAVKAFCTLPLMSGRRIGIVTYTGGFGIIGVDACEKFGLKLAELSSDTIEKASALSPSWLGVGNPVDIWPGMMISGNPMPFMEEESVNNLLCDWGVDAVVCVISAALRTVGAELYQITERAAREHPDKPLVFYIYGPFYEEIRSKLESTGKTLVFPNPDRAMSALSHLADYSQIRQKL